MECNEEHQVHRVDQLPVAKIILKQLQNIKMKEPKFVCKDHNDKTLDLYCTEDNDLVCSKCQVNHLGHHNKLIILENIREELIHIEKLLDTKI